MKTNLDTPEISSYYHLNWTKKTVFAGHRHHEYELKFILRGELEVTCEDVVLTMRPGDLMLYRPDVFHMEKSVTDRAEFGVVHFTGVALSEEKPKYLSLSDENLALAKLLFSALDKHCVNNKPTEACRHTAQKLLEVLLYNISDLSMPYHLKPGRQTEVYSRATKYMQEHLSDGLSVSQVAKHCGVCGTVLKEIFAKFTGHGAAKYYLNLRLEAAKQLLLQEISPAEVSERLGFSSPSYFSQCFSRECGCTPSAYKKGL